MFWRQSARVRSMKFLATLSFVAFHTETPRRGPEKSCHANCIKWLRPQLPSWIFHINRCLYKKFPFTFHLREACPEIYKMILARLKGRHHWTGPTDLPILPRKSMINAWPEAKVHPSCFHPYSLFWSNVKKLFGDVVVCLEHDLVALWSLLAPESGV